MEDIETNGNLQMDDYQRTSYLSFIDIIMENSQSQHPISTQ